MKRETICMHKNNRQMKVCFIWTIDCSAHTPTHTYMCTHLIMADLHKIWLVFILELLATKHATNLARKTLPMKWESWWWEQMKCCSMQPFSFHRYIAHSIRWMRFDTNLWTIFDEYEQTHFIAWQKLYRNAKQRKSIAILYEQVVFTLL